MKEKAIVDSLMPLEHGAFFAGLCSGVVEFCRQPFDTHKYIDKLWMEGVLNHVKVHYRGVVPPLLTAGLLDLKFWNMAKLFKPFNSFG